MDCPPNHISPKSVQGRYASHGRSGGDRLMPGQYTEYAFETAIEHHLTTSSRSGGRYDAR